MLPVAADFSSFGLSPATEAGGGIAACRQRPLLMFFPTSILTEYPLRKEHRDFRPVFLKQALITCPQVLWEHSSISNQTQERTCPPVRREYSLISGVSAYDSR